ncbi:Transcriptional regulator, AraC family [Labilithrix luteola]|uniref:Transcriptional regulator, AraC family n=1 Tax=Labilithrix luteola TaxID=1391654 RepID=A0A0K1PXI3_9BACT|nr:AraC family transcriptional regulator [Labilithrix luteola]AKU97854.1 Transcriptional regulator, AraC family [Labilithrix luteola]
MDAKTESYRELVEIITRHTSSDGEFKTAIPTLHLSRRSSPSQPLHTALRPCFALVVQGAKSLTIGNETLEYGVGNFLVASLDLPIVSRVTAASATKPNLGIGLAIDSDRLAGMFARLDVTKLTSTAGVTTRGVGVNRVSPPLLDAVVRLLRLLDRQEDIPALAPLYEQEILYRLLTGPCASRLLHIAKADTPTKGVAKATSWLADHFAEPLRIEELARRVGMSVSSLHHHFKAITAMSPLQYQKQLRLGEARRLILVEHLEVAHASFRVGYQSPSQFSREYARMFGKPPRRDLDAERAHEQPAKTRRGLGRQTR